MSAPRAVGVYRAMLRLYPRRFRDEYGPDMALLFTHQLRDEPAARVWARGVVDLAITVPTRHLEAHMDRPPNPLVPVLFATAVLFATVSVAGVFLAIVGGSSLGVLAVGLFVAVVAGALAVVAWRHTRPITAARPTTAHWWKFLTGGAGVLAAVIVVTTATGEVPEAMWLPMMITGLWALMLLAAGLVLGVAHLTGNRPR